MNHPNRSKKLGWKRDGNSFWNSIENFHMESGMSNKFDLTVHNHGGTQKEYKEFLDRLQAFLKAEKV